MTKKILKNKTIIGRENLPKKDNPAWWSCHYEYINRKTKEMFKLEELQEKYGFGFADSKLWKIIEEEYNSVEVYVMSINHPKAKNCKDFNIIVKGE